jgi:hypothetical protein
MFWELDFWRKFVGEYMADLVVEEKLIVELKCVDRV